MIPGYKVVLTGRRQKARLEANNVLKPSDFRNIAKALGDRVLRARKIGFVAAKRAAKSEQVETRWNGRETLNTARRGDWIVTNLSPERRPLRDSARQMNRYVIASGRFTDLYEPIGGASRFGAVYRAKGVVSAIALPGGFDIKAPWGERQVGRAGYLLLNGTDVYGNSKSTFEATYEILTE